MPAYYCWHRNSLKADTWNYVFFLRKISSVVLLPKTFVNFMLGLMCNFHYSNCCFTFSVKENNKTGKTQWGGKKVKCAAFYYFASVSSVDKGELLSNSLGVNQNPFSLFYKPLSVCLNLIWDDVISL